jgi:flagellin-specific chaperone FliS
MWQVEDTIRAFGCSLSRIRHEYIDRFDYDDEQKEEETDWFGNLIRMMNSEGCREQGHLQINKVVMQQLQELHSQLLSSPKFPFYNAEYYKVLPFIVELRNRGADKQENEIETCLNALYGVMMLRLQKKDITPNTQHAVKEITTLVGMLSDYYKKDKEEGLKFE